ncbi:hypothetical protein GCM10027271_09110 [Saccharopolyspora gloriosae]
MGEAVLLGHPPQRLRGPPPVFGQYHNPNAHTADRIGTTRKGSTLCGLFSRIGTGDTSVLQVTGKIHTLR